MNSLLKDDMNAAYNPDRLGGQVDKTITVYMLEIQQIKDLEKLIKTTTGLGDQDRLKLSKAEIMFDKLKPTLESFAKSPYEIAKIGDEVLKTIESHNVKGLDLPAVGQKVLHENKTNHLSFDVRCDRMGDGNMDKQAHLSSHERHAVNEKTGKRRWPDPTEGVDKIMSHPEGIKAGAIDLYAKKISVLCGEKEESDLTNFVKTSLKNLTKDDDSILINISRNPEKLIEMSQKVNKALRATIDKPQIEKLQMLDGAVNCILSEPKLTKTSAKRQLDLPKDGFAAKLEVKAEKSLQNKERS